MPDQKPNLAAAYDLSTPEDSRKLYADWAESYDSGFAAEHDYRLHLHTARVFVEADGQGPVLDIGAGTGLCGAALADLGISPVDGTDISAEMLQVAETKGIYRDLFTADLLAGLPVPEGSYAGAVSSGTFTHGHVGPEALDEVLRVVRPGGRCALSINARHFESQGFATRFEALADRIRDLRLPCIGIYGPGATDAHRNDEAVIALFRKL